MDHISGGTFGEQSVQSIPYVHCLLIFTRLEKRKEKFGEKTPIHFETYVNDHVLTLVKS